MVKKSNNPKVAVLAGAVAGGIEATATWPSEFCKTQLQLQGRGGQPVLYNGPWDCAKQTVKKNGFFGLYRGLSPVLLLSIPKSAIRFGSFNFFASKLRNEEGKMTPLRNLTAGVGAGVLEAFVVVTPMETLKVRLINANKPLVRGTMDIVKAEGLGGVYKGLPATIGRQASNQGIRFVTFNELKRRLLESSGKTELPVWQALLCGMTAGCCSVLGNNPIDVIKTRTQGLDAARYDGAWDCVRQLIKNEGYRAFYKGALTRMGRVVPGQGVTFASYEYIQRLVTKLLNVDE